MQRQGEVAATTTDPELQIKQETDSPNPYEHTICVKMHLPKQQVLSLMNQLLIRKRINEPKELQDPAIRAKLEQYRKSDEKTREEKRSKDPEIHRQFQNLESYHSLKEKFSYALFEPFVNRGKHPHIKFTHIRNRQTQQNSLIIRFNKRYYLEELKMPRNYLLTIPATFVSTWEQDFMGMVKIINKLLHQNNEKYRFFYTIQIKSVDLISFTFDVSYSDKRSYRFRYSPFEFRNTPFFKEEYQLVGYNQCISVIPQASNKGGTITDQDFYSASRCFIFDDLTDSNMFAKILQRTNIFYLAYSISRGITNIPDIDQFSKKSLWQFYFSTTRMKKFVFTWSFRPFRRIANRTESVVKEIQLQSKQMIFHVPFYVQIRELRDDVPYRVRVQYHDFNKNIPTHVKEEIIHRVKQWYYTYKQQIYMMRAEKEKSISDHDRNQLVKKMRIKEQSFERSKEKPDRQQTELQMYFGRWDKFDKFLLGLLAIVSTVIDRNYFSMVDDKLPRAALEDSKFAILDTPEIIYVNNKHQIMKHYHWLEVHLENKIQPYFFKQERIKTNLKPIDYRNDFKFKCGQWKMFKIYKCKREWNLKTQKAGNDYKAVEVLSFSEAFMKYIKTLLKHFSLKFIYKDILNFVAGICKNCYSGWEDNNSFDLIVRNQAIFRPIVSVIMSIYYNTDKRQQKSRTQEKSPQQEKTNQEDKQKMQNAKKDDRSNQQSSKKEECSIQKFYKAVVLKIITKGDPSFMNEDKLIAQVTFRIMEIKSCWITRMKDGFIMLRVFEDRIDFERQYEKVDTLKFNPKNKTLPFEDQQLREKLEKLTSQIKTTFLS